MDQLRFLLQNLIFFVIVFISLLVHLLSVYSFDNQAWTNYLYRHQSKNSLKNLPVKGLCGTCFSEFLDRRCSQSCLHFRTRLLTFAALTFTLFQLSPPPFPVSKHSISRQCVAGKGWGVLSPVGDHILQEFNTLNLTRFRIYKIARPSQTKT